MKPITKKQFDYFLVQCKQNRYIKDWDEISQLDTYEHVYFFYTTNSSLKLLVYTSIDKSTNTTRSYSKDRIRLVYQWNTKNGYLYCKVKQLNRTETILQRLPDVLYDAIFNIGDLRAYKWQTGQCSFL